MKSNRVPPLALAVAQGHAIFLDCAADRYFALTPSENDAVIRLLAGAEISERTRRAIGATLGIHPDTASLRALMANGLPTASTFRPPRDIRPGGLTRLSAIRSYVAAKLSVRLSGLLATLERLARIQVEVPIDVGGLPGGPIERIVGAHHWLSRHVTSHDDCLARSIALATHLRSSQLAASLVVGVRADPFSAHSWVQWNEFLLDEEADAVAPFTPIVVVR